MVGKGVALGVPRLWWVMLEFKRQLGQDFGRAEGVLRSLGFNLTL